MAADNVQLVLPATPEYARIARLTVAGLASRGGFGYDDVEDLRIAVGEACSLLLQAADPSGSLHFSFDLDDEGLRIEAECQAPSLAAPVSADPDLDAQDQELSEQILDAVVDESEIDRQGCSVRLLKVRTGT